MNKLTTLGLAALVATGLGGMRPAEAQSDFLTMSTLPPGTSTYLIMSTFAQLVSDELDDVTIQVSASGTGTQNMLYGARGDFDLYMQATATYELMRNGEAMFADVPNVTELAEDALALFAFPAGVYHIVTNADSGIDSLEDIKGKTAFFGPPGGAATRTMSAMVEASTGLVAGEDYDLVQVGWDAGLQSFLDGRLDVYMNFTVAPSPVIQQIEMARKVQFLEFTDEHLAKPAMAALANRPGGFMSELDTDVYSDNVVNEGVMTALGGTQIMATSVHLDDETAYRLTKAFWTAAEKGQANLPWLRDISLENAFQNLNMKIHPGAMRYYDEIGVEVPAELHP